MASPEASARHDFKTVRNSEITLQQNIDPVLLTITEGTPAKETMVRHTERVTRERDDYYDLMQESVALAEKHPTSAIGKWVKDYQSSQLEKNLAELDENDQATVIRLYQELGGPGPGIGSRAEQFFKAYVEEVVKKHEPEKVAECLAAGDAFFGQIRQSQAAQQEEYSRVQEQITSVTQHNDTLTKYYYGGAGLSGLGLLGLLIAGKLAQDEELAKNRERYRG
jgi:hypothetical protein